MIHRARGFAYFAMPLVLICSLWAQRRPDPLTPGEIDQLRDTAMDADMRLKLYVSFARQRLTEIEQMRADPKVTDRGQQTHDLLQEFVYVYDELNDNVDNFVDRKADVRRALKSVIEGDTEFQSKLLALKNSADVNKKEIPQYEFLLSTALEAVNGGAEDHRQLLSEQEEEFKHKKK